MWLILLFLFFLPLLLIGAFVAFLFSGFGENYLKSKIEEIGSAQLPSDVKVEKIQLDFFAQRAAIEGITISHPRDSKETYTTPHMLRVHALEVQADLTKLFSREIHLLGASIESSDVFFEGGLIHNNLKEFLSQLGDDEEEEKPKEETRDFNFGEAIDDPEEQAAAAGTAAAADEADDFDFVAEKVEFKDSGVNFKLTGLPDFITEKTEGMRLAVPDYHTDIGQGKKKGAATKEISHGFVSHMKNAVVAHIESLMESFTPIKAAEEVFDKIADHIPGPFGDLLDGDGDKGVEAASAVADILGDDDEAKGLIGKVGGFLHHDDDDSKEEEKGSFGSFLKKDSDDEDDDDDKKKVAAAFGAAKKLGSFF